MAVFADILELLFEDRSRRCITPLSQTLVERLGAGAFRIAIEAGFAGPARLEEEFVELSAISKNKLSDLECSKIGFYAIGPKCGAVEVVNR